MKTFIASIMQTIESAWTTDPTETKGGTSGALEAKYVPTIGLSITIVFGAVATDVGADSGLVSRGTAGGTALGEARSLEGIDGATFDGGASEPRRLKRIWTELSLKSSAVRSYFRIKRTR